MTLDFNDLLIQAYTEATNSPDPSTQTGAVIVGREGFVIGRGHNTFPTGLQVTPEMLERPLKYTYIEHAERNAVYDMAAKGVRTLDATIVCTWFPCAECARAVVQSGITRLVHHMDAYDRSPDAWKESHKASELILKAGGVQVVDIQGTLGAPAILHCGKTWAP